MLGREAGERVRLCPAAAELRRRPAPARPRRGAPGDRPVRVRRDAVLAVAPVPRPGWRARCASGPGAEPPDAVVDEAGAGHRGGGPVGPAAGGGRPAGGGPTSSPAPSPWTRSSRAATELPELAGGTGMTAVISTTGLVKRFGRLRAVDGIDLDVRAGDVYGFLGANGSGKTTTVRMLLGLVLPPAGRSSCWAGRCRGPAAGAAAGGRAHRGPGALRAPVRAARTWRCSTPAGPGALAHPRRPGRRGARAGGAGRRRRRPVKAYSLGMRQRLGLAGALLRRSGAAGAGRADQRPGPAGHHRDPRAAAGPAPRRDDGLPVQPPAGRGGAAVLPGRRARPRPAGAAGRLALRADRVDVVHTPDPDRVRAMLDGRVSRRRAALVVRGADPAEVNARLVAAGSAVEGWRWSGRPWRRWCWPRRGAAPTGWSAP